MHDAQVPRDRWPTGAECQWLGTGAPLVGSHSCNLSVSGMPHLDSPVCPLALSPQEERGYEQLIETVLQRSAQAFADYLDYTVPPQNTRWKLLKRRHNIGIYRSRESIHEDIFAPSNAFDTTQRVQLTKFHCVGTLVGSVDDAMLGSVSPTTLSMAARSLYVHDEFVQHQALYHIKLPTPHEPFTYLGLKWALRPSRIAFLVSPRDFVYAEATGFRYVVRRDGSQERIGFVVHHSVDRADVPIAPGVLRAKLSLCVFYRQVEPGVVQVFGSTTTNPGGSLPVKPAADSAANALLAVSRAMDCALRRKTVWLLQKHGAKPSGVPARIPTHKWWCGHCARELASRHSRVVCRLCRTSVCSRGVKTEKLALGASVAELTLVSMPVCTGCLAWAQHLQNAGQVALSIALGPGNSPPQPSSPRVSKGLTTTPSKIDTAADDASPRHRCGDFSHSSTAGSWTSPSASNSPLNLDLDRHRMLRMMNTLCLQAEKTYSATVSLAQRGCVADTLAG